MGKSGLSFGRCELPEELSAQFIRKHNFPFYDSEVWSYIFSSFLERVEAIRSLLASFPADSPPDLSLLHDAGCTCDDCDLPHHVTPRDTVRHLVAATEEFLKQLPKPAMVTIARSSRDDYCPPEDVDFIQELVLVMLKKVYGDIEMTLDYETEEDEQREGTSTST